MTQETITEHSLPSLKWMRGPANGGEGTAGGDRWQDGDLLLIAVGITPQMEFGLINVSVYSEGKVTMIHATTGDFVSEWDFDDISWWAKIKNHDIRTEKTLRRGSQ